jgi:ubiquitin-activating enzyme E1
MMGVATSGDGLVTVTDMDRIEKSNLSRQFLFRSTDINLPKSATAARAAMAMNPAFRVSALEARVGPDTETTFHPGFWNSLDFVITALDNVEARLYVDSKCVLHGKAMLESGTQGNKGNTQVVVPGVTVNYGATRDPPEKGIPLCTLHHFPNRIEHTLQWARDWFEGEFSQSPAAVNAYLRQPGYFAAFSAQPAVRWETLKRIEASLVSERPITLEECIQWARRQFEDKFNTGIQALLNKFPEDYKTTDGGLFWSPPKVGGWSATRRFVGLSVLRFVRCVWRAEGTNTFDV